jgi:ComF family protein
VFAFERAVSVDVYAGALQMACLRAKRSHSSKLAIALGDLLCERHGERMLAAECDVIVPVPLHWTSRLTRTGSLPDAISSRLGRFLKTPVDSHILRKVRRTAPQATLPPTKRRKNLQGAFRVARGVRLDGCRVLLVDDVLTTGTTAHRAARALIGDGGAASVQVAVVARGIGS